MIPDERISDPCETQCTVCSVRLDEGSVCDRSLDYGLVRSISVDVSSTIV